MANRHIIVGDVHGCLPELQALVDAVALTREDTLVFVGDLLDKGPDSAGVVRFVRGLSEDGFTVKLVKGNHEEKHERFRRAFAKAGDNVKMKGVAEMKAITEALSDEDTAFLETAEVVVPVPGGVAIHAGVLPTTKTLDLKALGKEAEMLMRVRHVTGKAVAKVTLEVVLVGDAAMSEDFTPDMLAEGQMVVVKKKVRPAGSFVSLGEETEEDPFWADVYDGRFGTVFFGHSPFTNEEAPVEFDHAVGLDLGAVFGNRLAAAVLSPDGSRSFVSVPSSGKFAKSFFED